MISLMFGIAGGFMILMLQLALWMIQASIVVGVELGVILMRGIAWGVSLIFFSIVT